MNYVDPWGLLRYAILVGDPGLGTHSAGRNFTRVALTRIAELQQKQGTTFVTSTGTNGELLNYVRISSVADFNNALNLGTSLIDIVIYFGHGGNGVLYIGQNQDTEATFGTINSTNLTVEDGAIPNTVQYLSSSNLAPNATITLNSCYSGSGGSSSIAQGIATQLGRVTYGWTSGLEFSNSPDASINLINGVIPTPLDEPAPLYMRPINRGSNTGQLVSF